MPPRLTINPLDSTIERLAHRKWVSHFNQSTLGLRTGNNFFDYEPVPAGSMGISSAHLQLPEKTVKKELLSACVMYNSKNYEQCAKRLEVLTRLCPEVNIMETFRNFNAEYFIGKKQSMLQIMDNLYKIIKR